MASSAIEPWLVCMINPHVFSTWGDLHGYGTMALWDLKLRWDIIPTTTSYNPQELVNVHPQVNQTWLENRPNIFSAATIKAHSISLNIIAYPFLTGKSPRGLHDMKRRQADGLPKFPSAETSPWAFGATGAAGARLGLQPQGPDAWQRV